MEIERECAAMYVGRIRKYYTSNNHRLTDDFGVHLEKDSSAVSLYAQKIELGGCNLEELNQFSDYLIHSNAEGSHIFFGCLVIDDIYFEDDDFCRIGIGYVFEGQSEIFETELLLSSNDCINLSNSIKKFLKTNFPT